MIRHRASVAASTPRIIGLNIDASIHMEYPSLLVAARRSGRLGTPVKKGTRFFRRLRKSKLCSGADATLIGDHPTQVSTTRQTPTPTRSQAKMRLQVKQIHSSRERRKRDDAATLCRRDRHDADNKVEGPAN
eukprot:GHVU01052027.1.p1 GENE.GHVU01052027.1~~GHVU01052027.1.p1  ORF type:complete len:132 (-),score=1.53 GHVU01052027.1:1028-1423(-)